MDILTLGLNGLAVGVIVAVTKLITSAFDPAKAFARWWPIFPAILAVIPALLLAKPLAWVNWQAITWSWFTLAAGAAYVYKFGKSTILGQ